MIQRREENRPAGHALWKASLRIGSLSLGVKLFAAVEEQAIHFHLLDRKNGVRVRQRMVHVETGETVAPEAVRRGVEVERGVFVVVDDKELARFEPEPSREIEATRFVPLGALDPRLYERPYWLGPDGQRDEYLALVEALEHSKREGIAHWAMRGREHAGALRVDRGSLALIALRQAPELVDLAHLAPPTGARIDERERKLASQLIAALAGHFDPQQYREEYRQRVLDLVAAKRKGKHVRMRHFRPHRVDDASLAEALRRSLRRAA